jgi:hypothetical protein
MMSSISQFVLLALTLSVLPAAEAGKTLLVAQSFDDFAMPTSQRLFDIAVSLRTAGDDVTILSRDTAAAPEFTNAMEAAGIAFQQGDAASLFEREQFDTAFLPLWFWNGATVPETYHQTLAEVSPKTKVVVMTDDAHTERQSRIAAYVNSQASLQQQFGALAQPKSVQRRESEAYANADAVISISESDLSAIAPLLGNTPASVVHFASANTVKPAASIAPMQARDGVVFVGYAANPTNAIGLDWFFSQVFPQLNSDMQAVTYHLVGAAPADNYASLRASGASIVAHGMVDEQTMNSIVAGARVMMAPIPASTGVNTKVYVGLSAGTPVVATSVAAAGLRWAAMADAHEQAILTADTPADFAAALTSAYTNVPVWSSLSSNGVGLARAQLHSNQFSTDLMAVVSAVSAAPAKTKSFSSAYFNKARLASVEASGSLKATHRRLFGSGDLTLCAYDGYEGVVCENGGACVDDAVAGASCDCTTGWTGFYCQASEDDCASAVCNNGGACVDAHLTYSCNCAAGFTGANCETPVNPCANHNCAHGSCVAAGQSFTCDCAGTGYQGSTCSTGVTCAAVAAVTGATGSASNNGVYPSSITYTASAGYSLTSGSATRTCGTNGAWSAAPTFTGVTCAALSAITGATFVTSNGGIYPSTVTYTASAGYTLSATSRTCGTSGVWSGSNPVATGVTCTTLTAPTSGSVSTTNGNKYPSTATYSCNSGFTRTGSATRAANTDGSWSGTAPTCAASSLCADYTSPCSGHGTCTNGANGGGYTCTCTTGWAAPYCSSCATYYSGSSCQTEGEGPICHFNDAGQTSTKQVNGKNCESHLREHEHDYVGACNDAQTAQIKASLGISSLSPNVARRLLSGDADAETVDAFVADVTAALEVGSDRIKMNSYSVQGDEMVFNFDITPAQSEDQPDAATLYADLQEQSENPDSRLRAGTITSSVTSVDEADRVVDEEYFGHAVAEEDDEELATTSTPAFFIGVGVAAAVVGLALIVTMVCVCNNRKSLKVTSSFDHSKQAHNGESAAGIPAADLEAGVAIVPSSAPSEKVWTFDKAPAAN